MSFQCHWWVFKGPHKKLRLFEAPPPAHPTWQARRIEEKQRLEAARAPHRWEAHNGTRRSVPVHRLETKALGSWGL